jgi:hypothetical protein
MFASARQIGPTSAKLQMLGKRLLTLAQILLVHLEWSWSKLVGQVLWSISAFAGNF